MVQVECYLKYIIIVKPKSSQNRFPESRSPLTMLLCCRFYYPWGGYIGSGDNTQSSLYGTRSDCVMCLLVKLVKLGCEWFQKSTDSRLKKCGWQGLMSSLIWPMQILIFLIIITGDETWRFLYDPKHTSVLWMDNKNISKAKLKFRLDKSKGEFWDSFLIRNVWFTMGLFQRAKLCVEILWPLRDAIRIKSPEQLVELIFRTVTTS